MCSISSLLDVRRGTQTPRVGNWPPYDKSDADEVIDMYAAFAGRGLEPWQCFVLRHGLGRSDDRWAAMKVGNWVPRQNGKGEIIVALELAWLFLPGFQVPLVTHSAHLYPTAQEAFMRLRDIVNGSDELRRSVKAIREANGEQGVITRTGQRLRFMARTRTAARGFSAPRVVLDEAQELQEPMMASVLPTISAQPDPQVWFFGTPPSDATAWAYNLRADGESSAPDLAWFDWGADLNMDDEDDAARVHDKDLWYQTNPALGIRIDERAVKAELRPSGLGGSFAQERLGVWHPRAVDGSESPISLDLWEKLKADVEERPERVAFAVHVNSGRTITSIAYAGRDDEGRAVVGLTDWHGHTGWVVDRVVQLIERHNPVAVAIQTRSERLIIDLEQAGVLPPDDPDNPRGGELMVPTGSDAASAYALFVDNALNGQLRHPDAEPLTRAVVNSRPRVSASGTVWDHRVEDIGPLQAASMALWAFHTLADKVESYNALDSVAL